MFYLLKALSTLIRPSTWKSKWSSQSLTLIHVPVLHSNIERLSLKVTFSPVLWSDTQGLLQFFQSPTSYLQPIGTIYWSLNSVAREGNGTPLQYSCLETPMDGGAWWAAVHGVAGSWTRLSDITFTFHFHALEKEMATHSSALAWRIPGMGEPGGLPSMGSHRVGHDWSNSAAAAAAANSVTLSHLCAFSHAIPRDFS